MQAVIKNFSVDTLRRLQNYARLNPLNFSSNVFLGAFVLWCNVVARTTVELPDWTLYGLWLGPVGLILKVVAVVRRNPHTIRRGVASLGNLLIWCFLGCAVFLGVLPWVRDNVAIVRPHVPSLLAWLWFFLQDRGLTAEFCRTYWWIVLLPIGTILATGRKGLKIVVDFLLLPLAILTPILCCVFVLEMVVGGLMLGADVGFNALNARSWTEPHPLDPNDTPNDGKALNWAVHEGFIDPTSDIYKANPTMSSAFCSGSYRPTFCISPIAFKLQYTGGLAFVFAAIGLILGILMKNAQSGAQNMLDSIRAEFRTKTPHEWKRPLVPGNTGTTELGGVDTSSEWSEAGLLNNGAGIRLGFSPSGEVLSYAGEAHGILVAPTRMGKGRDIIRPITLSWEHSLIVVCPKGEDPAVTKAYRATLGPVFVLNPYDVLADELGPSARYNPMQWLDPTRKKDFDRNCKALADAIVKKGSGEDSHWPDSAKSLISAVIGHLALTGKSEEKNLAFVREVIADDDLLRQAAQEAQAHNDFPSIRQVLAPFTKDDPKNDRELASIKQNARKQTDFIGTAAMDENLQQSDFSFRDLKRQRMTVYIVSSGADDDADKWFRLVVASAVCELMRPERGVPCLMLIDEFPSLGNLAVMQNRVMSMAAGYGLQVLLVMQQLGQLRDIYGEGWEVFASTDFQMYFAANDNFTRDHVSKLAGTEPILKTNLSVNKGSRNMFGAEPESTTTSEEQEPIIRAHEVGQIPGDEFVMFARTGKLLRGKRADYRNATRYPEFQRRHKPNPLYEKRVDLK